MKTATPCLLALAAALLSACGGPLPDDPRARVLLCNALSGEAAEGPRKQAAMRAIALSVVQELTSGKVTAAAYKADYDAAVASADAMSPAAAAAGWQACLDAFAPA